MNICGLMGHEKIENLNHSFSYNTVNTKHRMHDS